MKHATLLLAVLLPLRLGAETWLVEGGKPSAEMATAGNPATASI